MVWHIDGILGGVVTGCAGTVLAYGHEVFLDLRHEMVDGIPQLPFFRFKIAPVVDAAVAL